MPGVVTGKPISIGGSHGRSDATSLGVVHCLLMALKDLGLDPSKVGIAIQGFGKVGGAAARILSELGCRNVAVSDHQGGVYAERGLPIARLIEHRDAVGTIADFPGEERITNQDLLALDVDVLIPAALERAIRPDNADAVAARLIIEGANGPVTPAADEILAGKGCLVVPDILANAGGVVVSYFEWVQDQQAYFWTRQDVEERLRTVMETAYSDVAAYASKKETSYRRAALAIGVGRVAEAHRTRGLFP